jgi:hypothetical protein
MNDLPPLVLEDDLAGPPPVTIAPMILVQRVSLELLLRVCYQELPVYLVLRLESGQVAQALVIICDGQLSVQVGPVTDDDDFSHKPTVLFQQTA